MHLILLRRKKKETDQKMNISKEHNYKYLPHEPPVIELSMEGTDFRKLEEHRRNSIDEPLLVKYHERTSVREPSYSI